MPFTYAHELTHRELHNEGNGGVDDDGVPDLWESNIQGMRTNTGKSFPNDFNISNASNADADEEFYCVLGGAFQFGSILDGRNGPALAAGDYEGETPEDADNDQGGSLDWSIDGANW